MNDSRPAGPVPELLRDLRAFVALGHDILALAVREHQALAGGGDYPAFEFHRARKDLLLRLDPLTMGLRRWRRRWQECSPAERAKQTDATIAMRTLQNLIAKILQLDRENQQALLRRGLVPARQLNSFAAPPAHYVAGLYRRHTAH